MQFVSNGYNPNLSNACYDYGTNISDSSFHVSHVNEEGDVCSIFFLNDLPSNGDDAYVVDICVKRGSKCIISCLLNFYVLSPLIIMMQLIKTLYHFLST